MLIDDMSIGAKFCPEATLSPCTEVERWRIEVVPI